MRRLVVGAAVAVATLTTLSAPAAAEPPLPEVELVIYPSGFVVAEGATKTVNQLVQNLGEATATNVVLEVSAPSLDGASLSYPANCTVAAGLATCDLGDIASGATVPVPVKVNGVGPVPALGYAGSVTLTVSSDSPETSVENNVTESWVYLTDPTYDLAVSAAPVTDAAHPVGPGDQRPVLVGITNNGSLALPSLRFTLQLPSGTAFVENYPDCVYGGWTDFAGGPSGPFYTPDHVTCEGEIELAPGETLPLFDPISGESLFNIKIGSNVQGPGVEYGDAYADAIPSPEDAPFTAKAGTFAAALHDVVAKARSAKAKAKTYAALQDADASDNWATFELPTATNPTDLAVVSSPVTGHIGDTVGVPFTITNAGPADGGGPNFIAQAPTGTTFVRGTLGFPSCYAQVPGGFDGSWTEATVLFCSFEGFFPLTAPQGPGQPAKGVLKVKILSDPGTDGTIEVFNGGNSPDRNAKNDVAKIVIDASGLAVTGGRVGLISATGAGLLVLGFGLWFLGRRRSRATDSPTV